MASPSLNKLGRGVGAAMTSIGQSLLETKRQERLEKVRAGAAATAATAAVTASDVTSQRKITAAELTATAKVEAASADVAADVSAAELKLAGQKELSQMKLSAQEGRQLSKLEADFKKQGNAMDATRKNLMTTLQARKDIKAIPAGGAKRKATAPKPIGTSGDFLIGYDDGSIEIFDAETNTTSLVEKDTPAAKALREREKKSVENSAEAEEIFDKANTPNIWNKIPGFGAVDVDARWQGNEEFAKAEISDMLDKGYTPAEIYSHLLKDPLPEYEEEKPQAFNLGPKPLPVPIDKPQPTRTPEPTMIANGDAKSAQLDRLEKMRSAISGKYPDLSRTEIDAAILQDPRFKNLHSLLNNNVAKR